MIEVKGVRNYLRRNKIFFETVAAALLSAMAIIVSIAQFRTTSLQTQIAEAQALPRFETTMRQRLNDQTGKYEDNDLVVSNYGGAVYEFDARAAFFLDLRVGLTGAGAPQIIIGKAEVPVNGYFAARIVSASGTGQLTTFIGKQNNAMVSDLVSSTGKAAAARHWHFANLDQRIVLHLRYRDLLGRAHEDYYDVDAVAGGRRVAEAVGRAAFAAWEGADRLELPSLTPDRLLDEAMKSVKK